MSLYADERIDFEEEVVRGETTVESAALTAATTAEPASAEHRPTQHQPVKEEEEDMEEEGGEEEDEEDEEDDDEADEYDADASSDNSSTSSTHKRARTSRSSNSKRKKKNTASSTRKSSAKASSNSVGGKSRSLVDIPPELTRRSGRQIVKPLRYAEEADKSEDSDKRKNDEKGDKESLSSPSVCLSSTADSISSTGKSSQQLSSNIIAQRGTKRTRIIAESTKVDQPNEKPKKAKTATVKNEHPISDESEQLEDYDDEEVNVVNVSSDTVHSPKQQTVDSKKEDESSSDQMANGRSITKPLSPVSPARVPTAVRRGRGTNNRKAIKRRKLPMPPWDPAATAKLAQLYPDGYWKESCGIAFINKRHPLRLQTQLQHPGNIYDMVWSSDGEILATCSNLGSVRLWDATTWSLIQELRDANEEKIEEFYTLRFTPDNTKLFVAGKLKHRDRWSKEDDDNQVAPGPIKLFDVVTGQVLTKLEGHTEEILCIKTVSFKDKNYLLSASQDGYIIKWHLDSTWTVLEGVTRIDEETTNMALSLSFVPNCGNKYFMSAADGGVKIYDFEKEVLLQQFEEIYTGYCDCIKFISAKEYHKGEGEHYLITRGVEMLSNDDPNQLLRDNTCHLWKLTMPKAPLKSAENAFRLERVKTFSHPSYFANSWPAHITSNGRYIAAPTSQGEVFIWNLRTGDLVATLTDHEDRECRDVVFHPTRPILLTCCDDATVKVYTQDDNDEKAVVESVDLEGDIDIEGELADGEGEPLVVVTTTNEDMDGDLPSEDSKHINHRRNSGGGGSSGKSKKESNKSKRMRIEEELEAEFGDEAWARPTEEEEVDLNAEQEWVKIEQEWQKIEDQYVKIEREWSAIKRERALLRKLREEAGLSIAELLDTERATNEHARANHDGEQLLDEKSEAQTREASSSVSRSPEKAGSAQETAGEPVAVAMAAGTTPPPAEEQHVPTVEMTEANLPFSI